eukprot:8344238-Pyramimonas_sp.AAC.1
MAACARAAVVEQRNWRSSSSQISRAEIWVFHSSISFGSVLVWCRSGYYGPLGCHGRRAC